MTLLKKLPRTYYGDSARWFVGIVVNNGDPLRLGRVQVRIFGIHDDTVKIPDYALPWAQVLVPSTEDGISGLGFKPNLGTGATVFGFFWDGVHSQLPFILGSVPKTQAPNSSQIQKGPPLGTLGGQAPAAPGPAGQTRPVGPGSQIIDRSSSGAPSVTTQDLIGNGVAEKAFNYFISNGLTPEQAAGIIGNFSVESSMFPAALNPNDKGAPAYGLAQWRLDRADGLFALAARNGTTWEDLSTQLQWTLIELPSNGGSKLRSARTPEAAAYAFMIYFERPGTDPNTGKRYGEDERQSRARQFYEQFK